MEYTRSGFIQTFKVFVSLKDKIVLKNPPNFILIIIRMRNLETYPSAIKKYEHIKAISYNLHKSGRYPFSVLHVKMHFLLFSLN